MFIAFAGRNCSSYLFMKSIFHHELSLFVLVSHKYTSNRAMLTKPRIPSCFHCVYIILFQHWLCIHARSFIHLSIYRERKSRLPKYELRSFKTLERCSGIFCRYTLLIWCIRCMNIPFMSLCEEKSHPILWNPQLGFLFAALAFKYKGTFIS